MKTLSVLLLLLANSAALSVEDVDLGMGAQAVLFDLMCHGGPIGGPTPGNACASTANAQRADLGMALIAARNTEKSAIALLSLTRFTLDGYLMEDFQCAVSKIKPKFRRVIASIKPSLLRQQCLTEALRMKGEERPLFDDVPTGEPCQGEARIKSELQDFQQVWKRGYFGTDSADCD